MASLLLVACNQQSSSNAPSANAPAPVVANAQESIATPPPIPAQSAPPQPAPPTFIAISAQQLYADYHANEVLADTKYKGRWLYVQGVVSEIGKDFSDDPYINLIVSDNEFESVRANFSKSAISTLATLHKEDSVSLMCFGNGMVVGSPILDCARDGSPPMPSNQSRATETAQSGAPRSSSADNRETNVPTPQPTPQSSQSGTSNMWIGNLDMNLRSCPGTTCSALIVIPKHAQVSVDSASVRNVTEASGAQTPWARVTYSGPFCDPKELDQQTGCVALHEPGDPITGWVNYQRLSATPTDEQSSAAQ